MQSKLPGHSALHFGLTLIPFPFILSGRAHVPLSRLKMPVTCFPSLLCSWDIGKWPILANGSRAEVCWGLLGKVSSPSSLLVAVVSAWNYCWMWELFCTMRGDVTNPLRMAERNLWKIPVTAERNLWKIPVTWGHCWATGQLRDSPDSGPLPIWDNKCFYCLSQWFSYCGLYPLIRHKSILVGFSFNGIENDRLEDIR